MSEWLSLTAFVGTVDIRVRIVHTSRESFGVPEVTCCMVQPHYMTAIRHNMTYWWRGRPDTRAANMPSFPVAVYIVLCTLNLWNIPILIFSCDQAALWMVFSVRLSVCPSVCPSVTPFWLCSHHRIIMKFSGVITLDQGKVHAKGQGQRSKVKVTEVTTQLFVSGL